MSQKWGPEKKSVSQNRGPEKNCVSQNRGPEKKMGFKYWDRKKKSISNMGPEKNLVLKYGTGKEFGWDWKNFQISQRETEAAILVVLFVSDYVQSFV